MPASLKLGYFFTPQFRSAFSKVTLYIAIISFLAHLTLYFVNIYFPINHTEKLLSSPINAIYTPFSFLLAYEAYLLLYYLPQSTSIYIGKQYEIITLILIRGVFKDITNLNLEISDSVGEFYSKLWYDLATVAIVFGLIFTFYKISKRYTSQPPNAKTSESSAVQKFILAKKNLSLLLLVVSFVLGAYSLIDWLFMSSAEHNLQTAIDINGLFFDHFFSLLIMSDVIILLLSLFYTDDYSLIIRNSSFVISTILLKLSFSAVGIMEQILIVVGVSFGVIMYALSNLFERLKQPTST
ncbi:MAG: hypothetical protein RLZ10_2883 [Bacteroidota bacterium]|jgi:hypothetical protein